MKITNTQRETLCELLHHALVEIRLLAGAGKAAQAADLADAFHNLPKAMWSEEFSLELFRGAFLQSDVKPQCGRPSVRQCLKIICGELPASSATCATF